VRRSSEPLTQARSSSVSPFAADSARKGAPKAEASSEPAAFADKSVRATPTSNANVVIMGSAAPAVAELAPDPRSEPVIVDPDRIMDPEREVEPERPTVETGLAPSQASAQSLRDVVLNALGNQPMLASLLETAQWALEGNSLLAKVAASSTMIEMSFTSEARRIAAAAASGHAGRPIKVQVLPGGTAELGTSQPPGRRPATNGGAPNGSARSRAERDPVVQRMQEKFGAEIRTVIDYREKGRG